MGRFGFEQGIGVRWSGTGWQDGASDGSRWWMTMSARPWTTFFDPAPPMRAAQIRAGVIGAALADLDPPVDGDLPGQLQDQPQRGPLPLAQHPPHRVGQLEAAAPGELIQPGDQAVAGPGPVRRDHQLAPEPRRQRRDCRVQQGQVIRGRVAPRRAAAQHPGQRFPAGVIAARQQRVMPPLPL